MNENTRESYILDRIEKVENNFNIVRAQNDDIKENQRQMTHEIALNYLNQQHERKEFFESIQETSKSISKLSETFANLANIINDPEDGLIVKLNETVKNTAKTIESLNSIDERYSKKIKSLEDTLKEKSQEIEQLKREVTDLINYKSITKKFGITIIFGLLAAIGRSAWELISKP